MRRILVPLLANLILFRHLDAMQAACRARVVPVIDLLSEFGAAPDPPALSLRVDSPRSDRGHEFAGRAPPLRQARSGAAALTRSQAPRPSRAPAGAFLKRKGPGARRP